MFVRRRVRGGRVGIDEDFVAYYNARGGYLRTTAYLLCGDWHLAQDLTQLTFTNLYRAWRRIERHDSLDQYARKVLLRAFLDERRRPWRHEVPVETVDPGVPDPGGRSPDDRLMLKEALSRLAARQRAVLVLRFWADLSVEQTADALGCSTGTVKSQTSVALASMRRVLGSSLHEFRTVPGGQS